MPITSKTVTAVVDNSTVEIRYSKEGGYIDVAINDIRSSFPLDGNGPTPSLGDTILALKEAVEEL